MSKKRSKGDDPEHHQTWRDNTKNMNHDLIFTKMSHTHAKKNKLGYNHQTVGFFEQTDGIVIESLSMDDSNFPKNWRSVPQT